jgi:HEAT repeat protein
VRVSPLIATALWVATLVPSSVAAAQPPEQRVRALLSAYEQLPGAAQWRALGPDTLAVLISLHDDPREPTYVRLRALAAAGHFPVPRARAFLLRVARAPEQDELFVREALLALQRAFKDDAVEEVSEFLRHERPLVRRAAATGIGRMDRAIAEPRLRRHLDREHDRVVRRVVQRVLRRLTDPPG